MPNTVQYCCSSSLVPFYSPEHVILMSPSSLQGAQAETWKASEAIIARKTEALDAHSPTVREVSRACDLRSFSG